MIGVSSRRVVSYADARAPITWPQRSTGVSVQADHLHLVMRWRHSVPQLDRVRALLSCSLSNRASQPRRPGEDRRDHRPGQTKLVQRTTCIQPTWTEIPHAVKSCETNTTVTPRGAALPFFMHLAGSSDAYGQGFINQQDLRIRVHSDRESSRTYIPEE